VVDLARSNSQSRRRTVTAFFLFLALIFACPKLSQSQAPNAADSELRPRLSEASRAQQSGDPEQIARANKRIIAAALLQMAEIRSMEGLVPTSIDLLKQSKDYEDTPSLHMSLALAYAGLGSIDDALQECDHFLRAQPKSAVGWGLQGRFWAMKKEYQKAVEAFEKSLAIQPDLDVAYSMGSALLNLHDTAKAAIVFKRMERLTEKPEMVHIMAGRAYEGVKLQPEAEREYKAAIAINPKTSRGHYFLGLFYLVKNSWEPIPEARQQFLAEVAINPKDFFGNYFLGYLASVEKKYGEADKFLRVAAAAKPDWPEPYLYMGLNAYGAGSDSNAETLLRKAITLTGTDEARNNFQIRRAYFTLGRILIRTGKREEGTELIKKSREMETKLVVNARNQALSSKEIVSSTPTSQRSLSDQVILAVPVSDPTAPVNDDVLNRLNLSEEQKLQAKLAEKQLRGILSNAYNDLGTSEARQKDYALALTHFRDAERWQGDTPGLKRNIGMAAYLSGNFTESIRALREVVAINPTDQRSEAMLAMSLFSIQDYPAAANTFGKIPDLAMGDPQMSYGWAASLARSNDREHAASILEKMINRPLPDGLLVRACQLYDEMQNKSGAQSCFEKAKQQDPTVKLPE
jgi:tetratricopeptide (TPR) repeat protein